jgi:tetratricopeptide (TPR) repeat protein
MNRKDRRKHKSIQNNSLLIREFMHAYNYHEKGMLEEAKLEYKKILLNHPDHFDTIRHLGIVHQSQNDLEKAASFFRTAQKINPLSYEIYNNLGSVLFASYKLQEAIEFFEKSLSIQPDYIPALNNVSLIYYRMRYEKRALKASEKALQLQPNNLRTKTNHALALSINDKLDEAIEIFEDIIKEEPNGANYKNLATALRDAGETKKSFEVISKALKESPNDEAIFFNLAASNLYKPALGTLNNFKNILKTNSKLDYNQKTSIAFGLHNSYKKLKDYKTAGEYLVLGNKFSDTWIKPDLKNERKFFNEIKKTFTKDFIKNKSLAHNLSKSTKVSPIFILGMPRSGTTLCEQIIASHSKVTGGGELPHLIRSSDLPTAYNLDTKSINEFIKIITGSNEAMLEKKAIIYLNSIKNMSQGSNYVTDKMPHNFVLIGYIKIIFPNAKIIYCKRDPIDNCYSMYAHKFVDMAHGYSYNQEVLGRYYKLHCDLMDHWFSIFGNEIFTLNHEKLIENQELISKDLIEYCELQWEESCLEFYKTKRQVQTASNEQVRQPINKKSIAAWKKYEDILGPLLKSLN